MHTYEVLFTAGAERDLQDIHDYVAEFDSAAKAASLQDKLLDAAQRLQTEPERGSYPKELLSLGIRDFRQSNYKPYRIIYRVLGLQVYIYLIADGRREMSRLLMRRLLEA
ncbi:type II toxin-antitoxin system RelE/ParE family toxin [Roseateles oligotrophus]|uniref:Type II toxin-antitoxin system RelE/ParE family toxin n=1 Tax=Roseateles oligotrophus TaxID=1769250 RepID=A0ABT2YJD9_9BURK|nr:type II toxin-antitoxin system RelE/ParE family toxin [Roseateles oligotrophus]MCV2370170.1 type II toxin-antitoxin system RelE/ParE family toxin [Roseateles oligotrophus]